MDIHEYQAKKILSGVLLIAALYSIVWLILSNVGQWVIKSMNGGTDHFQLDYTQLKVSDFPSSLKFTLSDVELVFPQDTGKTTLQTPELVVIVSPWSPLMFEIQTSSGVDYQLKYDDFHADFNVANFQGKLDSLRAIADISLLGGINIDAVEIDVAGLKPPLDLAAPYHKVDKFSLNLGFNSGLPSALTIADLQAWRQDGGSVETFSLSVNYGDLNLVSSGSLELDEQLRLAGDATVEVVGFMSFAEMLGKSGLYTEVDVIRLKEVLTLLVRNEDSSEPSIHMLISVEHDAVYLGHLPVVRIPYLSWL